MSVSQSSFLDDLASWSSQECKQNLEEAVPRLILFLSNTDAVSEIVEILKTITKSFVPILSGPKLHEDILSHILNKVCLTFEKTLQEISVMIDKNSEDVDISSNLMFAQDIVSTMESCVQRLIGSEVCDISEIHALPEAIFLIIKQAYQHCKDSSSIYGDLVTTITNELSALFKATHSLQMSFIRLADQLKVKQEATPSDVRDLSAICWGLFEITEIVVCLDIKIMISSWKALIRIFNQHKAYLRTSLDVGHMVAALCAEIQASLRYLLQSVPANDGQVVSVDKAFTRSVKVLGFQMKLLLSFVRDCCGQLGRPAVQAVVKLMLALYRHSPPSLTAQTIAPLYAEEVRRNVLMVIPPLILSLLSDLDFIHCVTKAQQDCEENDYFPLCMIQVLILEQLPSQQDEVLERWILPQSPNVDGRCDLVTAVFTSFSKCHAEICCKHCNLPSVTTEGKPRHSGFYEHVCIRLCGFIASFPSKHFHVLEKCLLRNVLGSSWHSANLAKDAWCFLSRYSSAALCRQHFFFLAKLTTQLTYNTSSPHHHLVSLLCRMFKFLAPEHQTDLLEQFPVSAHLSLYSILPLSIFSASLRHKLLQQLSGRCVDVMRAWQSADSPTYQSTRDTIVALDCLTNAITSHSLEKVLSSDLQREVCGSCLGILSVLPPGDIQAHHILMTLTSSLIQLISLLFASLQNSDILKILLFCVNLMKTDVNDRTRFAIIEFLRMMGKKNIVLSPEQLAILQRLSQLFSELLADSTCMLHQVALQAFSSYAGETNHESVVSESLQNNPALQNSVVSFLNQEVAGPSESFSLTEELSSQSGVLRVHSQRPLSESYKQPIRSHQSFKQNSSQEPKHKRLKLSEDVKSNNDCSSDAYRAVIQRIQEAMDDLCALRSSGSSAPEWLNEELQCLHVQVQSLLS